MRTKLKVLSHVFQMFILNYRKANEFARENMKKTQHDMKTLYDKKARTRSFKPGERVMVLLPSTTG